MFRACAWCGIFMGVIAPLEDERTTHGLCPRCAERLHREQLGRAHALVIVAGGAAALEARLEEALTALECVEVVRDRRQAQRRRARAPVRAERRQLDRRRTLWSQREPWSALGIQVVPVPRPGSSAG
jgi:hypothetical protein